MSETIYITGHKNPDSDSICAAIAYAEYKNASSDAHAIPVRLGKINQETKFILNYFQVETPILLETVKLSVDDLNFDKILPANLELSLQMAVNLMKKNKVNSLPVINEDNQLVGIVTESDIVDNLIEVWDNSILGKAGTSVDNIMDTLSGSSIYIPDKIRPFSGKVIVLDMESAQFKDHIGKNDIVICGNRREGLDMVMNYDISLLIVTGKEKLSHNLMEIAKKREITIMYTSHDVFTASRLIYQSIPVKYIMTKDDLVTFYIDDLVDEVHVHMSQTRFRSYPVIDNNKKVYGLISRYHLISSKNKKVILVDHNERNQSVDGLEEAEILEIIDHHRVANVFTGTPVYFRNEPVGSTSTIIASIFFERGRRPTKKTAGILAAAIISDTLLFKSPTSTSKDRDILERLARIADLDIDKFAMEMFKAGTSLVEKTPQELLNQDFKVFKVNDGKIGIAQVHTLDRASLENMKEDLLALMEEQAKEYKYSAFILMLTDIFAESSEMIVVGPYKSIVEKAFGKTLINNSFYIEGILSRKKQVVPPITNILSGMK